MEFLTLVDCYSSQSVADRYRQIIEMATVAEELGFDFFWVGEHHGSHFYSCPSPILLLSAIAARTSKIRIGPGVCQLAHHDPLMVAESYAMLDVLSGGRLDMVIGRPNFMRGYTSLNHALSESLEKTQEGLQILTALWRGEAVEFGGRHRKLVCATVCPRPVQSPHPPIFVAAGSPASAKGTAESGHGLALLSVFNKGQSFRSTIDAYRQHAKGPVVAGRHTFVDSTDEGAEATFGPLFQNYVDVLKAEIMFTPPKDLGIELPPQGGPISPLVKGLFADAPVAERLREQTACGSPATVANRITSLVRDMGGVDAFWNQFDIGGCSTDTILKSMRLYAEQVRPIVDTELSKA